MNLHYGNPQRLAKGKAMKTRACRMTRVAGTTMTMMMLTAGLAIAQTPPTDPPGKTPPESIPPGQTPPTQPPDRSPPMTPPSQTPPRATPPRTATPPGQDLPPRSPDADVVRGYQAMPPGAEVAATEMAPYTIQMFMDDDFKGTEATVTGIDNTAKSGALNDLPKGLN